MDKLKMATPDLTDENILKMEKLFPNVVTETTDETGNIKKIIDFEQLRQMLSKNIVEDSDERYRLDWPGKKASILKANTKITKTLRPCKNESVNFDTTENLYIEGDNFEVLKVLQESYLGKVKMIYIDPPYNTGKDFVYKDNFKLSKEEYESELDITDEDGGKLVKNTDTNGRFHSDWLSMMYTRLIIARDLLTDDGVIFMSIDDNEVHNLRKIADEIFGEENFVQSFMWLHGKGKKDKNSRTLQQYIICFSKNKFLLSDWKVYKEKNYEFTNPDNDPIGPWFSGSISFSEERSNSNHKNFYEITSPSGVIWKRQWQCSKKEMETFIKEGRIYWGPYPKFENVPRYKIRPGDIEEIIPENILSNFGTTQSAQSYLDNLLSTNVFNYPKPINLIKHLISLSTKKKDIILDFFSGSATTSHAIMQLNAEDGGNRKFIMVQLPEELDENRCSTEAEKQTVRNAIKFLNNLAKPLNICEIGKERIRRAGKKILEENAEKLKERNTPLDIGFRVYKTDSSNMKDVFYHPSKLTQDELDFSESNIKDDRTAEDLLTQVILDLGLELSLPIEEKEIKGNKIFFVQTNALVACFDQNINFDIIDEMATVKPFKAVFKDACFKDDKDRINVEERFKRLSPETKVMVL